MTEGKIERSLELERLVFFSDAVIAIAITLLALELRPPNVTSGAAPAIRSAELVQGLIALLPKYLSFLMSFWIIGTYWLAHHRLFRYIVRYDEGLIILNLLWLLTIIFLPFPTAVLGDQGDLQPAIILYAVSLSVTGIVLSLLWRHAVSNHLVRESIAPPLVRHITRRGLIVPFVGLLVILVSYIYAPISNLVWLLIIPLQRFVTGRGDVDYPLHT